MVESQSGTYSVPVRGNMCHDNKTFAFLDVFLSFLYFLFLNDFRNHIYSLIFSDKGTTFFIFHTALNFQSAGQSR